MKHCPIFVLPTFSIPRHHIYPQPLKIILLIFLQFIPLYFLYPLLIFLSTISIFLIKFPHPHSFLLLLMYLFINLKIKIISHVVFVRLLVIIKCLKQSENPKFSLCFSSFVKGCQKVSKPGPCIMPRSSSNEGQVEVLSRY